MPTLPESARVKPFQFAQLFRRMSFRVVALSTLLVALALLVVTFIIVDLYRNAIERRFDTLLSAHLFSLVAGANVTADNRLVGVPQIGDQRYQKPDTGWVWEVLPASSTVTGRLASTFLTEPIIAPTIEKVPFDASFQRFYVVETAQYQNLRVLETEVQLGAENAIARFRVAGNLAEVEDETRGFLRQTVAFLSIAGLLMIAINAAAIVLGLRPLDRAREQLGKVRAGEADSFVGSFPPEIEPLANEINALIENNKRIVDRARVQVGDLAHALKTPLAVIINEAGATKTPAFKTIGEQANIMRHQIEHYLQRARIAAQTGTIAYRTDTRPILEKMVRVFKKLNPDKKFELVLPKDDLWFAGEAQDFEEIIGNLLENAAKWSQTTVRLTLQIRMIAQSNQRLVIVSVEDDGPGIPAEQRTVALTRGKKLDETKAGTGLGLSIVSELVREYRGQLDLSDGTKGGLKVTVALPLATR
jgi:signal transduction histidine kinase